MMYLSRLIYVLGIYLVAWDQNVGHLHLRTVSTKVITPSMLCLNFGPFSLSTSAISKYCRCDMQVHR